MEKRLLLTTFIFVAVLSLNAQSFDTDNYRTIDGNTNNIENTEWGAAGVNLIRFTEVSYADSISAPAGPNRPNPRDISNALFAQESAINDPLSLSDFCWVWGQFIDHDIGLTENNAVEPAMIPVPVGDPWFDPLGTGQVVIPMMRNRYDEQTGTDPSNPRQHPNQITAFIDGSAVYGSDQQRADWLRTFEGGKLKTSSGNLLPFNTMTGEFEDAVDPDAPHMADDVGVAERLFVAGDVRANENPLLTSFHTLFVREHNHQCDVLAVQHPDWTDEQLYQHARKIVGGLIQAIVYEEWLPTMGVHLPEYSGYQPDVNPGLLNVFTAAAFRLGHTLLNSQIQRVDNNGEVLPEGNLLLREGFFNPMTVVESGGVEPFIKGMAVQIQQGMDPKIVNDVRNFLFGPPGAGGLDLASININRGRERGLPDFNTVRENFGLQPYQFFQQISSNAAVFTKLLSLYANINDIDPWVGMLAEEPMPGALFGETIMEIMMYQFGALRDGDRFYYENDPVLSAEEKNAIKNTTLHDIIMRNTGITLMQDNVFEAMPHGEICGNMTSNINGVVMTEVGETVSEVNVSLATASGDESLITDAAGSFVFEELPSCEVNGMTFLRNDDASNGVSTFDLILIQKHILGVSALNSPYKILAADVDRSDAVTTLDLIRMRKVILGIDDAFPNNTSWRFVVADHIFSDPLDPWADDFPEDLDFDGVLSADFMPTVIAIKVGDVNNSADPAGLIPGELEVRNTPTVNLLVNDMLVEAGSAYEIDFAVANAQDLEGFQLGLQFEPNAVELIGLENAYLAGLTNDNFANFAADGLIRSSWNAPAQGAAAYLDKDEPLFSLAFVAKQSGRLSDLLQLERGGISSEAYSSNLDVQSLGLLFHTEMASDAGLMVYQNQPNPFANQTIIPFELTKAERLELTVFDVSGRVLLNQAALFNKGYNEWQINRQELAGSGILYYKVSSETETVTHKMVVVD